MYVLICISIVNRRLGKRLFMSIVFCLFENYFDDERNFLYKPYVPLSEIKILLIIIIIIKDNLDFLVNFGLISSHSK